MSIASTQPPVLEISLLHGRHRHGSFHPHGHSHGPVYFMGGGPRTYPGGVSKWQWKRMQLKKAKQIEKARLMREKHVYEARRRAELLAASPVLEMPWQKMSRVRPPNYVSADEQVTKLAARFQKEGAEDLWTEKDGPERFESLEEEEEEEGYDYLSAVESGHRHGIKDQDIGPLNSPTLTGNSYGRIDVETPLQSFRHIPRRKPSSIQPFLSE